MSSPWADCLVWRNRAGRAVGVLSLDRNGKRLGFIVLVDPGYRLRGIATKLLTEALRRWPELDIHNERYTQAGAAWISAFLGSQR